jgi:tetratricopeptide (TPR) repeat protein
MRIARLGFLLLGPALLNGCAPAAKTPRADPAKLVREAGADLAGGCYRCLKSAAEKYEAAISAGVKSLDAEAARAWILVEARERELGLKPSDALARARAHAVGPQRAVLEAYVRVASGLPRLNEGVTIEAAAEASLAGRELAHLLAASPVPPTIVLLREKAKEGKDAVAAYLDRSITCFRLEPPRPAGAAAATSPPPAPAARPSGLMDYLNAICPSRPDARAAETLARIAEKEPRFHEAHYFLGRAHLGSRRLVSAEKEFLLAADGLPMMAAAWSMLGTTRLLMEEYEWAAADLGRALRAEPNQRGALLSQAQALAYAGRFEEALVPAQRLIDLGEWYQSDANYWLALSELQLGRLQEADVHVREAKRTNPVNGDTARLTGLVAQRTGDFDRAQTEFELAVTRNASDCESLLHLGQIHARKERAAAAVESFEKARDCFGKAAESAALRRKDIETSALSDSRKQVAMARVARRIEGHRAAQAGASFGAAEVEAQRGAWDKSLSYLAEAEADRALAARVRDLKARIAAQRARR